MAKKSKAVEVEGDPKRGDALLKRMLQSKPKTHEEMAKERRERPDKGHGKIKDC